MNNFEFGTGSYRADPINFDVPIRRDKVMNANIEAHIVEEEKMVELGFIERQFYWELREKVSFIPSMEEYLIITIGKKREGINIKVYDEFVNDIYDYQQQIYDDDFNEYAYRIHNNVQETMMKLVDAGVITGYKKNDYI